MKKRLTRPITESEIKLFNPTRPSGSKYSEGDYVEKRDVTDLECYRKLGQLEDIEEELGIDLITLFKAIHNGVWVKNSEQGIHFISLILWNCEVSKINNKLVPYYSFYVWDGNKEDADEMIYHFKDYGKTWALTKEELENNETNIK